MERITKLLITTKQAGWPVLSYSTFLDGLTRRTNLNQKVKSPSCRLKLGQIKYGAKG